MKTLSVLIIAAMAGLAQQPDAQQQAAMFSQAANILRSGGTVKAKPVAGSTKGKAAAPASKEPDFTGAIVAKREPAMPDGARVGLAMSENNQKSGKDPFIDNTGRLTYIYGHSYPTVVCSTLNVCEIDLEPGEQIVGGSELPSIDIGDPRFKIAAREAGAGPQKFPYVIVKPTEAGLDTSLAIGTTVRPYYIHLISTDKTHMTRVAFSYPEDDERKAKLAEEKRQSDEERQRKEKELLESAAVARPVRNRKFSVALHGRDSKYLKPKNIWDDGAQTHIEMSEGAHARGLPVVEVSDARGTIPANSQWDGNTLVVDAVFEHACLLSGVGKKQQRACIENGGLN